MRNDKAVDSGVIAVFVPGLEDTPGWLGLSRKKQDALLEHTSHIQQNRQLQMLGEFGELMELYQVQQLLEGEKMQMKDYMRALYSDRSIRTAERKREAFAQLVASIPSPVLKRLSSLGTEVLSRFDRIANAAIGDIRNAVKELPALTASTEKDVEKYLEGIDSKLHEHRLNRRKRKPLHQDEQFAAKMAANALINYMRSCGLKTSAEKRNWLVRVAGWAMEAEAVSGNLRVGRVTIPEGILIRRGRPRKKRKEAA